ncbi:MAG: hypothetical protein IT423_12540 [Pirellulaceae bacterium]|nr:hypothetical protein [Pirellulaceae bacterium]
MSRSHSSYRRQPSRRQPSRRLHSEQLESRRPLAADLAALDVNTDGMITPVDALIVINEINSAANRADGSTSLTAEAEAKLALECDTNGDGVVSPQDVLGIINQLNSGVVAVVTETTDDTSDDTSDDTTDDTTEIVDPSDDNTTDDNATDDPDGSDDSTDLDPNDEDNSPNDDPVDDDPVDDDPSDDDSSDDDSSNEDDSSEETPDEDEDEDEDGSTGDDQPTDEDCDHGESVTRRVRAGELAMREILDGSLGRGLGRGLDRGLERGLRALDANGDGKLTSDEVPEALWEHLIEANADADEDGALTLAELKAYREAKRLAAIEAIFEQLDRDDSGMLTSSDLPRLVWRLVSRADANDNGEVSLEEFISAAKLPILPLLRGR